MHRDRQAGRQRKLQSTGSLSQTQMPAMLQLGQGGSTRSWESSASLPERWQEPNYLTHQLLPPMACISKKLGVRSESWPLNPAL